MAGQYLPAMVMRRLSLRGMMSRKGIPEPVIHSTRMKKSREAGFGQPPSLVRNVTIRDGVSYNIISGSSQVRHMTERVRSERDSAFRGKELDTSRAGW
jgi:hypothetical protein